MEGQVLGGGPLVSRKGDIPSHSEARIKYQTFVKKPEVRLPILSAARASFTTA